MTEFARRIWPLLDRRTRRRLVASVFGAIGVAAIEAVGLLVMLPLVQTLTQAESGTIPSSAHWVSSRLTDPTPLAVAAVLAVIALGAFIVKGIASLLYLRWNIGVLLQNEAAMGRRLLQAYLRAPYRFHLGRNSAELQRTVHDDIRRVYQEALVAFVGGCADIVLIAVIAIVLLVVEPIVAVCAGIYFAVVSLGYQRLIHGRARAAGLEIQRQVGESYRLVQQSVAAAKEIKLRHSEAVFVEELFRIKKAVARRFRTMILLHNTPRYYLEIALVSGVAVLAGALYSVRSPASATALLSLFVLAGLRLLPCLNRVLVSLAAIKSGQPAADRIAADLALLETEAPEDAGPEMQEPQPGGDVEFDGVRFSYEPDSEPVLDDVSFRIEAGESVAFVGPSGAGKSTLLDILLGLLDPVDGGVRVGGKPIDEVRTAWQRSIGYVPQDVVLLDESLRANVALGVAPEEIDDAEVRRALDLAELTDVVRSMPEGLETRLGERGVRLSGGQRQRVGLARALYHRPAVLVLDEATSSLDGATEARITETIDSLQRDLTVVTVTHRLSTVRNVDRIYLLERGVISGCGRFEQLVATNASFALLARHATVSAVSDAGERSAG
ncbi:MAG: ABC transporter ATP-binding protein [Acidimicrobiales bacterium]